MQKDACVDLKDSFNGGAYIPLQTGGATQGQACDTITVDYTNTVTRNAPGCGDYSNTATLDLPSTPGTTPDISQLQKIRVCSWGEVVHRGAEGVGGEEGGEQYIRVCLQLTEYVCVFGAVGEVCWSRWRFVSWGVERRVGGGVHGSGGQTSGQEERVWAGSWGHQRSRTLCHSQHPPAPCGTPICPLPPFVRSASPNKYAGIVLHALQPPNNPTGGCDGGCSRTNPASSPLCNIGAGHGGQPNLT